jgi:hypothetical protein
MLTYNTKATVSKDHELAVSLSTDLAEGEYAVVIKVKQGVPLTTARQALTFGSLHLGPMTGESFRREEIYGDDGR